MRFWRNPEFIRHFRAEMRPLRALNAAVVMMVIAGLLGLSSWASEPSNPTKAFENFYYSLAIAQGVILAMWCAWACGRSLANERDMKTFDFLRTTRLTPAELMVGSILGVPVMAYFVVACSLPFSLIAGLFGGISLIAMFWTYVLILVFALFSGLLGLWGSMLVEGKTSGIFALAPFMFLGLTASFLDTPFPGFSALTIVPAVGEIYKAQGTHSSDLPTVFGLKVSFLLLALFLYAVFGAWLALMIVRNLKRERTEIKLLSRGQAVGLALFLDVLFFAFLNPARISAWNGNETMDPGDLSSFTVFFDLVVLYFLALATLVPGEKLRAWWRKMRAHQASAFSEYAPSLPWIVGAAAIAYGLFVAEIKGLGINIPSKPWQFGAFAVYLLISLVFVLRDQLFLQWCVLSHMKKPLGKGILYLGLYYAAAAVSGVAESAVSHGKEIVSVALLTPFGYLSQGGLPAAWLLVACLILQTGIAATILVAILGKLKRPAKFGAVEG